MQRILRVLEREPEPGLPQGPEPAPWAQREQGSEPVAWQQLLVPEQAPGPVQAQVREKVQAPGLAWWA